MLNWAIVILIIALIAGLGFGVIGGTAFAAAKAIFVVALLAFLIWGVARSFSTRSALTRTRPLQETLPGEERQRRYFPNYGTKWSVMGFGGVICVRKSAAGDFS